MFFEAETQIACASDVSKYYNIKTAKNVLVYFQHKAKAYFGDFSDYLLAGIIRQ